MPMRDQQKSVSEVLSADRGLTARRGAGQSDNCNLRTRMHLPGDTTQYQRPDSRPKSAERSVHSCRAS
jgi:hypothetical protein